MLLTSALPGGGTLGWQGCLGGPSGKAYLSRDNLN